MYSALSSHTLYKRKRSPSSGSDLSESSNEHWPSDNEFGTDEEEDELEVRRSLLKL